MANGGVGKRGLNTVRCFQAAVMLVGGAWLVPTAAQAQIGRSEFRIDARQVMSRPAPPPRRSAFAAPVLAQWRSGEPAGMMRSWSLDGGARFGFGRFDVLQIARPRTNLERERMPLERRASSIAGAGVRLAF